MEAKKGRQIEAEATAARYAAELIVGAGTDSEQAIRWLIALMVLRSAYPQPSTGAKRFHWWTPMFSQLAWSLFTRTAISFVACCLNSFAAFSMASPSLAASTSPIHTCSAASL